MAGTGKIQGRAAPNTAVLVCSSGRPRLAQPATRLITVF